MIYKLIFLQSPEDYQLMNRSYSHNFRTFPSNKNKSNLSRSSANFQFRTVWKTRDTHQILEPKKTVILHNSSKIQAEQPAPVLGETAGHQQMRQFIKMMKKNPNQIRSEQTSKSCANPSQNLQQNSGSHVSPAQIIKKNSVPSLGINKIKPVIYNNTCQSSRSVRSTKSVKSNAKSIRQSRAQSHIESQIADYKADTRFRESTYDLKEQKNSQIEDLERKIQLAIQTKLQKFSGRPRQTINSTSSEDELDKELKKLLKNLQDLPSQSSASTDADIRKLAHKIGIIEKLMASSSTQHEILKKYYFSTQNIRKNYATINDQAWKDSNPMASDDMKAGKNWSQKFVMTTPPSIHYQTTTGTAFIPPSRNSYTGQNQKRAPYIPNRQPMPRSLYQREFLYYGIVPTYSSYSPHQQNLSQTDPKLSESIAEQESEAKLLTRAESTYKQDYKCKKVQLVDSKQLDCRRDKHRNADVNFMGNRSDFTSVYEHNLKKALSINRSSCGGKRYQSKKGQDGKENVHRNFRNNSFSKKSPLSAHPNHNSSQSQIQLSKPLPFNSKTEHQSQFKDPYPLSTTFNVNISQVARTDKQEQRSSGESKCLGNLTSQKGKKGVLEAYIKQKNLNSLKYLYKCEFAI